MGLKYVFEKDERLERLINSTKIFDIPFDFDVSTKNGWKLSILGKNLDDVRYVFDKVHGYLEKNKIPFKVATKKRIEHSDSEQKRKIMTIYIPDSLKKEDVAEKVYTLIKDYKGWHDIKTPSGYEGYAGGVYWRNDRDSSGNYIPAKGAK